LWCWNPVFPSRIPPTVALEVATALGLAGSAMDVRTA
jgi:hypothetical protein